MLQLLADRALGRCCAFSCKFTGKFSGHSVLGQIVAVLIYEDGPLEDLDCQNAVRLEFEIVSGCIRQRLKISQRCVS